jgi:predicted TIM-barrel fold metal-dependent hydrolase
MIDAAGLPAETRRKIFETNARKVYRLDRVAASKPAGAGK